MWYGEARAAGLASTAIYAAVISSICAVAAEAQRIDWAVAPRTAAERTVARVDSVRLNALLRGDTTALNRIYADDFRSILPSGAVRTRAEFFREIATGRQRYDTVRHAEQRVEIAGDVAMITGRSSQRGREASTGTSLVDQTRYVRVYVRRNERWLLHYTQLTSIGEPSTGLPARDAAGDSVGHVIERLDWQRFQASQRADVRALDTLLTDDWLAFGAAPTPVTKAQYLAELSAGTRWYGDIKHDDVLVRRYGETAIITGRMTGPYRIGGVERNVSGRFTHVYVRQGGRWRMAAMHTSIISG